MCSLDKAKSMIDENKSNPPTVASVAEELGVNRETLAIKFKKRYGITMGKYIQSCRDQFVMHQIENTELSFSAIDARNDFDIGYTSKVCKRVTGMNAGEYRESFRGGE